jgi:ABC-type branched-subunit amino acid transport system substrate-binding protein
MRTPLRHLAVALAAGSLLALSACSDSVEDDGPTGSASSDDDGGGATTRGITNDTITVGGSLYGVFYGDASVGVEARLKVANDAGGVHGRTFDFVGAEDNNNEASKDLDIITRLVEQEEVFAILPSLTAVPGAADYVVEKNVPMFGWGTNPSFCENEVAFGITGCVTNPDLTTGSNSLGTVLEQHFDGDTDKTVAFIGEDNDASRGGLALLTASVEDKGFEVVYAEPALPAPPEVLGDESPYVTELLSSADGSAPDVIYLQATLSGTKLAAALQAAGYEGMIITPSYSPLLLGQPGYDDIWVNTQFGMDPELPANAEMLEAVQAVKADQQLNLAVSAGYWAADMFVKAVDQTGPELTVESFLETLNGGSFTYEVPDVVGPSTWPDNHDQVVPCGALTEVTGDQFVPSIGLTCGENITIG